MIFKERQSRDKGVIEAGRLMELHLYPGNQCNRECDFCTVFGAPKGWYTEYTSEHLDATLRQVLLHGQGAVKFFGGEPTLNHENVIWAIAYLREQGFQGAIVIYSNGIQADRLLEVLESDPLDKTTASLNYSIATGDGAPQMPLSSLRKLEDYEQANPGAIAIGHPDIVDSGRGVDPFTGEETRPKVAHRCPHCYPVLKTNGQFHACPFAVENSAPHFQIGSIQDDPETVADNFQTFLNWLDTVHEPFAIEQDLPACTVCWQHLKSLPPAQFKTTQSSSV
ncbi:radical SAM protein [Romeria aff. gracilis LEGE 07310]|uniref:Radical SAM protein n=1 Tax=Vasconcelosia minhoensis LEGE 07310 TaxID=915328 RepID=A0A8J7DMU7_9CYAN|nr:radical SAM protein [Romeria gracilis]MBE9077315.1 radical SAM protein [Romeria aff. gracilis LEGE 07310]